MELRERIHHAGTPGNGPDDDGLESRRAQERSQQAARRIAAGRAAVASALSGDSEEFLKKTRQRGGQ